MRSHESDVTVRLPVCGHREETRARWGGIVTVWVADQRLQCRGMNLSEGGIALSANWGVYAGRTVSLEFDLFGRTVRVTGVVTWAKFGSTSQWGVCFRRIAPDDRERIGAFVASRDDTHPLTLGPDVTAVHRPAEGTLLRTPS